ncbi:hypothetical protein FRC11_008240, partial [Ceratobasidium sp. 423]
MALCVVSPSLTKFITYTLHQTCLLLRIPYQALLLLEHLRVCAPATHASSGHHLFLTAFIVTSKSAHNNTYSTKSCTNSADILMGIDLCNFEVMVREQHGLVTTLPVPLIHVTSPPQTVVAPTPLPALEPQAACETSLPAPIVTVPRPALAAEPQVICIGTLVLQDGPLVIHVTSPAPETVIALIHTAPAPLVYKPPHVICIGALASQEGPQVIHVTSPPAPVVAAPIASESPHIVHIGGSSPQEGPQVICITSPIVAPTLPVPVPPLPQVIHGTNTHVEPMPSAPANIDPASTQLTIVCLGPSEPVQPEVIRISQVIFWVTLPHPKAAPT